MSAKLLTETVAEEALRISNSSSGRLSFLTDPYQTGTKEMHAWRQWCACQDVSWTTLCYFSAAITLRKSDFFTAAG